MTRPNAPVSDPPLTVSAPPVIGSAPHVIGSAPPVILSLSKDGRSNQPADTRSCPSFDTLRMTGAA
jgi:hypothetical protein